MTYPNLLVVRYLEAAGRSTPESRLKSEQALRLGYQNLLGFQNRDGGFAWFAGRKTDPFLTAYGLMQLAQMRRLIAVDPAVIDAAAKALRSALDSRLSAAGLAYAAWALHESGDHSALDRLLDRTPKLRSSYERALALQPLLAARPRDDRTRALLAELVRAAVRRGERVHWTAGGSTLARGAGRTADIECTALAALALLRDGGQAELAQGAVDWLIEARGPDGAWGSTQATVLALMALLQASIGAAPARQATTVRVVVNGRKIEQPLVIAPDRQDVVLSLDLSAHGRNGKNKIALEVDRPSRMTAALVWQAYRPWPEEGAAEQPLTVRMRYESTRVRLGDHVLATAHVRYRGKRPSSMVLLEIGVPPGFQADEPHLRGLVAEGAIARFSIGPRRVTLYVEQLAPNSERDYPLLLRAARRARSLAPATQVYEYYRPEVRDRARPARVEVF